VIRVRTTSRTRPGFTLVEMLTVIVIIGILASLITAAAIAARTKAREGAAKAELTQLEMAVENYKIQFGEYPPDFADINPDLGSGRVIDTDAVERHIKRRWPRYDYTSEGTIWAQFVYDLAQNYGLDATNFDASVGLIIWLGGLPETAPAAGEKWRPAGFHSDPTAPFKPGGPRTEALYDFKEDRLMFDSASSVLRYYPFDTPEAADPPLVYFRSQRVKLTSGTTTKYRYEYGTVQGTAFVPKFYMHNGDIANVAAPILDSNPDAPPDATYLTEAVKPLPAKPDTVRSWRAAEKFQILCAGMDKLYGVGGSSASTVDPSKLIRYSRTGFNFSTEGEDRDNLANFSNGRLEDEL